jgi:hypothetical protein
MREKSRRWVEISDGSSVTLALTTRKVAAMVPLNC